MAESRRVFLIKPGDVLVIGNAGPIPEGVVAGITGRLHAYLGIPTVVFAEDIDLTVVKLDKLGKPVPAGDDQ